jgi:HEAT repeat protein
MIRVVLPAVALLMAAYAIWALGALGIAVVRARSWRSRALASADVQPRIREALVEFLAGNNDLAVLRAFVRSHPDDLCDGVLSFSRTVGGGARDRLCELTLELGLVSDWMENTRSRDVAVRRAAFERLAFVSIFEPCRRMIGDRMIEALRDADREVRLSAVAAVTRAGNMADVERVFEMALTEGLLARILFTEPLRPHVYLLSTTAVSAVLRSHDPARIAAALEILLACQRALPLEGMAPLMLGLDQRIRVAALKLAPLVAVLPENQQALIECLSESNPEVLAAAASSIGKLQLTQALPHLARLLRTGANGPARAAAAAMAEMPPTGWKTLEELSTSSNASTAAAAGEALERARARTGAA